jgi:hypothetical protein
MPNEFPRIVCLPPAFGRRPERGRTLVLHESIQNGLFWSNVVTLSLLACLSVIVVYQHQHGVRREWTVAEVLQQYENALSRANARVDSATRRNHELTEAITSARETALRSSMISLEHREPTVPKSREKRAAETQPVAVTTANAAPSSAAAKITADGNGSRLGSQMGLFKPEVDLVLKVNSLEQQLGRSQEHEKHLRRQLTHADQRLQAEQQKNRTLKGE